jgi:hypothetical protein
MPSYGAGFGRQSEEFHGTMVTASLAKSRDIKMSAETVELPKDFNDWLNEQDTRDRLQRCADTAIAKLRDDLMMRIPRSHESREHGFAAWREQLRNKLATTMQEAFTTEFSRIADGLTPNAIRKIVAEQVWPNVERELIDFAVEGLALVWVRRHLGDALILDRPQRKGSGWVVQLDSPTNDRTVGHVILDGDGNVVESESSTRRNILAVLNG